MRLPGVVYYDIAESENRLRIGVEGKKEMERIQHVMTAHGIPTTAFIVEAATPPVSLIRLTDHVRPLKGGLEISFSSGDCTFSFNVRRGTEYGLVTNSHCTAVRGLVDGRVFY